MKALWNDIVNPYFLLTVALTVGFFAAIGFLFGYSGIGSLIGLLIVVTLFVVGSIKRKK